jgi:hypothetical protein
MAEKSHTGSRAKSALSGKGKSKSKSSGKKPHRLTIRHGKSGGHVVTHHFEPDESGMAQPDEEHVLPDQQSMLQHVADNTDNNPISQPLPQPTVTPSPTAGTAPPAGM